MPHTSAKNKRVPALSALLSERAALHGRLAVAAQRRLATLGASILLAMVLAGLAVAAVVSWWWLVAPLVAVVTLLVHGRYAAVTSQRELKRLNQQIKVARSGGRRKTRQPGARPARGETSVRPRAAQETKVTRTEGASEIVSYAPAERRVITGRQVAAEVTFEADAPETSEDRESAPRKSATAGEWTPRPMPKPLYTMRATAPRREVIELEIEQPGERGRVPVRPVRARRPQTGALSSAEVAAGAAMEFDVDSVIEQRRAAAG